MSIGSMRAFPKRNQHGMTYRQWLIGEALKGFCAIPAYTAKERAQAAIKQVDTILDLMEEENESST